MKTIFFAAFLLSTSSAFADLSGTYIGLPQNIVNKDFSEENQIHLMTGNNEIALTFDDGPSITTTPVVLDILKKYNIKATFFLVAKNVLAHPELAKRILDEGHIVGNHSLSHQALTKTNLLNWKSTLKKEIIGADTILLPYMTNSEKFYFRAPGGGWIPKFADYLNNFEQGKKYIGPIFWDIGGALVLENGIPVSSADWDCWSSSKHPALSVDTCLIGYLNKTRNNKGGVVLMHDLKLKSAELVSKYIPILIAEGYSFKTLDDIDWEARTLQK